MVKTHKNYFKPYGDFILGKGSPRAINTRALWKKVRNRFPPFIILPILIRVNGKENKNYFKPYPVMEPTRRTFFETNTFLYRLVL